MTRTDYEFLAATIKDLRVILNSGAYAVVVVRFVDALRTRYSNFDVLRFYQFLDSIGGVPASVSMTELESRYAYGDR